MYVRSLLEVILTVMFVSLLATIVLFSVQPSRISVFVFCLFEVEMEPIGK